MSAAAPADLSSLQQLDFGGGQSGFYDPSSGTYYDSGGNVLSAADLAQYGSFTVTGLGTTGASAPPTSPAPVSGSGSGGALSGLTGIFSAIGNAIVQGSRPTTITTPQGTLVYNPQTGGYTTQAGLTAQSTLNPLVLLALAAGFVWLIWKEA
jgi:hypothetical protein